MTSSGASPNVLLTTGIPGRRGFQDAEASAEKLGLGEVCVVALWKMSTSSTFRLVMMLRVGRSCLRFVRRTKESGPNGKSAQSAGKGARVCSCGKGFSDMNARRRFQGGVFSQPAFRLHRCGKPRGRTEAASLWAPVGEEGCTRRPPQPHRWRGGNLKI